MTVSEGLGLDSSLLCEKLHTKRVRFNLPDQDQSPPQHSIPNPPVPCLPPPQRPINQNPEQSSRRRRRKRQKLNRREPHPFPDSEPHSPSDTDETKTAKGDGVANQPHLASLGNDLAITVSYNA
jgi:hypothetical protein